MIENDDGRIDGGPLEHLGGPDDAELLEQFLAALGIAFGQSEFDGPCTADFEEVAAQSFCNRLALLPIFGILGRVQFLLAHVRFFARSSCCER